MTHTDNKQEKTFDIIVVGGGIVGLSMALLLARGSRDKDLSLALIDAQKVAPESGRNRAGRQQEAGVAGFDPRVSALTATSQALFEQLGLWAADIAPCACPYQEMYVWDGGGTGHIRFSALDIHRHELGHIVENTVLTHALNQALAAEKTLVQFRGEQVSSVEREAGLNLLRLADGTGLRARLLIAADGANSFIRQESGFKVRQWSYEHKAIVATVRTEKPHGYTAAQCFLPSGPLAFLPLTDKTGLQQEQHYSSIVWSCDSARADEILGLDDEAFRQALQQAFENRLGAITATSQRFSFPLWQRHAVDYIQDGLALIGDAAHTIHPLAGQGVNLGLQDARALAGVIEAALRLDEDYGSERVLSRYQRQRKGPNLGMMSVMEAFKWVFGSEDLTLRWLRNTGLDLVDRAAPVKQQLMKKAMGI